jgi:hypothetical protein
MRFLNPSLEDRGKEYVMDTTLHRRMVMWATGMALAIGLVVALAASPASAAPQRSVDPSTLKPAPSNGVVAQCKDTGNFILCQTYFDEPPLLNEPVFELSCGTVYETSDVHNEGLRRYSSDGYLLRRFVTEDVEGSWSLSDTGEGPTVRFFAHDNYTDVLATPGEFDSASTTFHGLAFTAMAPGYGVIWHIAGSYLPDGRHHGVGGEFFIDDEGNVDPGAEAALCEALQP